MFKKIFIAVLGVIIGIFAGFYILNNENLFHLHIDKAAPKKVIGFLPYWLLDKVSTTEEKDITTLTYFALNVDGSGHIVKLVNPQQEDPGWYDLQSEKVGTLFANAKKNNVSLSLLISSGDAVAINQLMTNPIAHANTLIKDVTPVMKQYDFKDLNLDIEDTSKASKSAQTNFTLFVKEVKQQLDKDKLGTLTIEISPTDVIEYNLINVSAIAPYANTIVVMAYDYHSPDSFVTGPIAPLNGAGIDSEYDVATAIEKTLQIVPSNKVILGMPLYGYEWETLNTAVRSAVIPGSGVLASNNRAESLLSTCATCSAFFDNEAQEEFVVFQDSSTGTYHQIAFPTKESVSAKIAFANKENLGGVGLWALGYEGGSILTPFIDYK